MGVDPNNSTVDGGNVAQYTYTNDANLSDEWIFEPFIAPYMEYDQGFFMYHSGYSSYAIQQQLNALSEQLASILYAEFGLRCGPARSLMIPSLADDCNCILYSCGHGSASQCTNTYNFEEDRIHYLNWLKNVAWYAARGRQPNGLHILWQGHPKCIKEGTQHSYFQMAQKYYYAGVASSPFMLMNLPLNVQAKQLIAFLLAGISKVLFIYSVSESNSTLLSATDAAGRVTGYTYSQ